MEHNSKIFVAGGTGMVGSAIIRKLLSSGYTNIISNFHIRKPSLDLGLNLDLVRFDQLDLTRQTEVEAFFEKERPEYVFLAAAKVGGIMANNNYPAEFIYSNLMVQTNIIHSSYLYGVKKLLFLGSSCIYPRLAPQPMKEEYLLSGYLEPTNEPYAVAKIAGIRMCQSYNRQYGTNFISVMPTNLYGPNDNFDLTNSHVLPALIRKFHEARLRMEQAKVKAKVKGKEGSSQPQPGPVVVLPGSDAQPQPGPVVVLPGSDAQPQPEPVVVLPGSDAQPQPEPVVIWGSGSPFREFLHVDDLADACVFVMQNIDSAASTLHGSRFASYDLLNIGSGKDVTIKELADIVKDVVGFKGETIWDSTKPDGTPKKLLDISRMRSLGWEPKTDLRDGIKTTYDWYLNNCQ